MTIREVADRLYVSGMPNPGKVNRYFICSGRLRDQGWHGTGDYWWQPGCEAPVSFDWALRESGLGSWYDWAVVREILELKLEKLSEKMMLVKTAAEEGVQKVSVACRKVALSAPRPKGGQ